MQSRSVPSVTRLTLSNFRNYESLRLDIGEPFVALSGPNGAGKTNLIEAVSLLAPGRGLRGVLFEELARKEAPAQWAVAATVTGPAGPIDLGTQWTQNGEAGGIGREISIERHRERGTSALARHIRVIWLTPAMDRLFAGPAAERRRFLDRLAAGHDPEHGARIAVYEKLMRERNLLNEEPRPDQGWLSGLEAQMAEAGTAIAAARLAAASVLQKEVEHLLRKSAFPWSEIRLQGDIEDLLGSMPALKAEDEFRRMLQDGRQEDRAAGRTLKGPHRSDVLVTHGPKAMEAASCSTGEQKALLIGMILAQAAAVFKISGLAPILLLDEVAAHLDEKRRHGLYATLGKLAGQAWLTGTDRSLFDGLGKTCEFLHVEGGKVTKTQ
ncbi:MAG: DNA replication/repair protein RecF [Parvibaculaceae bacterium]